VVLELLELPDVVQLDVADFADLFARHHLLLVVLLFADRTLKKNLDGLKIEN
jgi:hypothetical protein